MRSRALIATVTATSVVSAVQAVTFVESVHTARALASAATGSGGQFVSLQGRLLDTRAASQVGPYSTPMVAGAWRSVTVDGQVSIPATGVAAVAVSITVIAPSVTGLLHADKDEATPNSTVTYMNYVAGSSQSSSAVIAVASDGKIQIESSQAVNVVVDVQGYYTAGDPTAGGYVPVTPQRLVDTRNGTGLPQAQLTGGSTSTIQVGGNAGVPTTASGVMAIFTLVNKTGGGDHAFTPYPADEARSVGSYNFQNTGLGTSIGAQVGLSTTGNPLGAFKFYLSGSGYSDDLAVDVVGYFTAGTTSGAFTPAQARVWDSRVHVQLGATSTAKVQVTGVAGVPAAGSGLSSVTANVGVIDASTTTGGAFIEVWADAASRPTPYDSMSYTYGQTTSNMVTTSLSSGGALDIYNSGAHAIDFVIDVEGWYSNAGLAVTSGQDETQQSVALQADPNGAGAWVTYQYRVGTSATFTNVPVANTSDGSGSHPSAWPVQKSSGTFAAYTWNIHDTLAALPANNGLAPDSLIQVIACYGVSSTDPNPACGMPWNIDFAQSAFGATDTTAIGPGALALLTGDYSVEATDAAETTSLDGLSIGRTFATLAPADAGTAPASQRKDGSGIFGPGWTSDLSGPDAGHAQLKVTDQASSGYLLFTDTDGGVSTYQATSATTSYPITFAGTGNNAADGEAVVKKDATTITMTDADNTVTTWTYNATTQRWRVLSVAQPGSSTTNTYTYNGGGQPTRILAPVPDGVVGCDSAPDTTPGCRSILLNYQTMSVGGVNVSRVQVIQLSLPQTAGTARLKTVAAYDYNSDGTLADTYNPQISPTLTTAYTYDTNGRLATLTPPGQAAWTFHYDSGGRLSSLTRPDAENSATATTTIVYNVATSGSGAPVDLSYAKTATWNETADLPVSGTAIFNPDHVPAAAPTSTDWPYATIHYLDVNGLEVNTAAYGAGQWLIDTSQYDTNGNLVWDLSAGNQAQALAPTSATDGYVASLASNLDRAALLTDTRSYASLDPSLVTDIEGPTHPVQLANGATVHARTHVSTTYDEGAPNNDVNSATGFKFDLPTTVVTTPYIVADQANNVVGADASYPDAETTHTGYDPIDGASPTGTTSGWTLARPTTSTVQMAASPSSSDLVTKTRFDASGRVVESRLPGDPAGNGPRTTDTTYYATTATGPCVSATAAGLVCQTTPAGQPATGSPLPTVAYTYDAYGDQLTKVETYGSTGVVRTSAVTYDSAQRPLTSSVAVSPASAGGIPVPKVNYGYDATTGLPTTQSTGSGTSLVTLTTGYNSLAQPISYVDATGNVSSTKYDLDGRPTSVNDGKSTVTYNYDSATEHRGRITSEDIGVSSSPSIFSATYNLAGNLSTETYPNGMTLTSTFDNAGNATSLTYVKAGNVLMTFGAAVDSENRIVAQESPQSSQHFAFDQDGRLVSVHDTFNGSCTTRNYSFDTDSNRTNLDTYPAASDGSCTSGAPSTPHNSFDQADRLVSDAAGSYAYDTLGRTLTVPAADAHGIGSHASIAGDLTISYYANDFVASQSQGSTNASIALDPLQNRVSSTTIGTQVSTNHYSGSSDSPSWSSTSPTAWTRNVIGLDGNLAATVNDQNIVTLNVLNLHGDIAATIADDPNAVSLSTYPESDEYGNPRLASSAPDTYGWLGGKQRSTNLLGGLSEMGIRLYNSSTGNFLSPDPVYGGNANAYGYPYDPVNGDDLTGRCWVVCTVWHAVSRIGHTLWRGLAWVGREIRAHWRGIMAAAAIGICSAVSAGWCFAVGALAGVLSNLHRDGLDLHGFIVDELFNLGGFGISSQLQRIFKEFPISKWEAWAANYAAGWYVYSQEDKYKSGRANER